MADPSPQGNLFKVDMRLRPEGMGDMAKTYESYLEHYETRSQPWELQALIKARPCAGDKELGERFLKDLEPLIYRKSFDPSILKEMREIMSLIKKKMETKGSAKTNVKLGKGGIREIEFMVQLFQLVHGGQRPEIRRANTLEALEILEKNGLLLKTDAVFLAEAYRFLRNTEHHLQMVQGLQTHTLPKKPADMERLARSLGFKPPGEGLASAYFKAYFLEVTLRVNSLYREVFKIKDRVDPSAQVVQASLEENREELERNLEAGFFFDSSQAASNLMALSRRLKKSSGPKGEILWASFVPDLFKGLKKVPHPDRALNQMESFLRATSLPDLYIRYLRENPKLFDLLLELFSNSLFLSRDPHRPSREFRHRASGLERENAPVGAGFHPEPGGEAGGGSGLGRKVEPLEGCAKRRDPTGGDAGPVGQKGPVRLFRRAFPAGHGPDPLGPGRGHGPDGAADQVPVPFRTQGVLRDGHG